MRHKQVLSLDIGTSALKAALIAENGQAIWLGHQALPVGPAAFREWDADWWIRALDRILADLRSDAARAPAAGGLEPDALVISGHGPSLVALDAADRVIGKALLWLDPRQDRLPGTRSYYLPKIAWWCRENPALQARATRFASVPEWLGHSLTGELATVCPHEDFAPYIWVPEEIAAYGIDPCLLPPLVLPGSFAGRVRPAMARAHGLPAGLPVYAGGSDFMMSLAGTGSIIPGATCDRAGSSEGINFCSADRRDGPGLRVLPHLVEGAWNIAGILPSTGLLFEWFRSLTGMDRQSYHDTLEAIGRLPIRGDLPFFREQAEPGPPGGGAHSVSFTGLKLDHQAIHLARAVVESIGFSVRARLETMRAAGCGIGAITLSGGQAKNRPWVRMKADITGHELAVPHVKDAELLGDAMMGMIGLGVYPDLGAAVGGMLRIEETITPDPAAHREWSERYAGYRAANQAAEGTSAELP